MQKSRNYIFFIELVPGGKGEGVDTAKLAIRRVLDQLFDRTHRFRLRRFSQSIEERVGFAGKFHGDHSNYRVADENGKQVTDTSKRSVWFALAILFLSFFDS